MLIHPSQHQIPMGSFFPPNQLNTHLSYDTDPTWQNHSLPRPHVKAATSQYGAGLTYAQHEVLRQRKTPRGKLFEQFDANGPDDGTYPPATKHILLSPSSQRAQDAVQHVDVNGGGGGSNHLSLMHGAYSRGSSNLSLETGRYPPAWDFPGGIDSTLNQNPQSSFTPLVLYNPRSNVPTVLPGSFQSTVGPTASAGQQYYGPYWPDGTFNPYRPASIRFENVSNWRQSQDLPEVNDYLGEFGGRQTLRRSNHIGSFLSSAAARHGQAVDEEDSVLNSSSSSSSSSINPSSFRQSDPKNYRSFHDRIQALTSANEPPKIHHFQSSLGSSAYNAVDSNLPAAAATTTATPLQPTLASDQVAFRDRSFIWAHGVYVNLLAHIQRQNKLGKEFPGQYRLHSKPSIYPRPPQRTGSHFSEHGTSSTVKSSSVGNRHHLHHQRNNAGSNGHRSQMAPQSLPRRISDFAMHGNEPNALRSPFRFVGGSVGPWNEHDARKVTGLVDAYDSLPHAHAPTTIAISALDTMELLCQEADSPWTDGMLLAGCLAYGLANYRKALSWYQRILQQDPTHVEAISNLAATLLAIGRRDEALLNWQKAVRLRPSYFEAVEHLIGLLCQSQRAREAVDTIKYVESCLKLSSVAGSQLEILSDGESDDLSRASSATLASSSSSSAAADHPYHEYDFERRHSQTSIDSRGESHTFGAFGYAIPAADNGRLLALVHAKGNMLYALGDHRGAAEAFEEAILIATGEHSLGIRGLIDHILKACAASASSTVHVKHQRSQRSNGEEPLLLAPERAQQTARRLFPPSGNLPGLESVPSEMAYRAATATASNSLLSLAKIYQDGLSSRDTIDPRRAAGTREILALYYLSLSLQPSPSTANNVGILLAGVQNATVVQVTPQHTNNTIIDYTGIVPGSGVALALMYYNYGLNLDGKHAHLYTNLGSLLKDLGQLPAAIKMYETAVSCDGTFDIALANLANAVKDQGRIREAIEYYRRAVQANPDFAEAVCGLATALNSVCNWHDRGGVYADNGERDRIHVDDKGMMYVARNGGAGWMNRVVSIVEKQLCEGEKWGVGLLNETLIDQLSRQLTLAWYHEPQDRQLTRRCRIAQALRAWSGQGWEGSRIVRLVERAIRSIGWLWYHERYQLKEEFPERKYTRPQLPATLSVPNAPTVLPFHTFTTPLSAKQVRQISQRNALRISVSTLRSSWLPCTVYPPPAPPAPFLKVGYVSSDFNNHPLAHLMQSVFGLHDPARVRAVCYATTPSDNSIHREQVERESPIFYDASAWNVEKLVNQIVRDGIHILVNLNGYTRGARNEVFAARPAPIHMSFMGFAGTLGAEWCDYIYADSLSISAKTLAPQRRNVDIEDKLHSKSQAEDADHWIYAENIIFSRASFFCVDHKQSAPDAKGGPPPLHNSLLREQAWCSEQDRRWKLRKQLFPQISDTAVIFGNFNQLYKIDPATFRMYLRILNAVPNAVLWLLRFPDAGEQNLLKFAKDWAGNEVASRIIFTDVAPKGTHITRASVVDLFLDTPECNAHTTAADVVWSGTPIITWARWDYKMCSRMASSIVSSALPEGQLGDRARADLLVTSEKEYEDNAIDLASKLRYPGPETGPSEFRGRGRGRLMDLRRILWEGRWSSRLFDTKRWVRDLEEAYWKAWGKWEIGEGGDIWL